MGVLGISVFSDGLGRPMVKNNNNNLIFKLLKPNFFRIIFVFWKRWLGRVQVSSSGKFSSHFLNWHDIGVSHIGLC